MSSKRPIQRFQDIVANVDAIIRYTEGLTWDQFRTDQKSVDATLYCLLRISEAVAKLGETASKLVPEQPWQPIRALGNRLRHDYDTIELDRVWIVVKNELGSLRTGCATAIAKLEARTDPGAFEEPPPSGSE